MKQKLLISGLAVSTVGVTSYLLKDKSNRQKVMNFIRNMKTSLSGSRILNHSPSTKQATRIPKILKITKWYPKAPCTRFNIMMTRRNNLFLGCPPYQTAAAFLCRRRFIGPPILARSFLPHSNAQFGYFRFQLFRISLFLLFQRLFSRF